MARDDLDPAPDYTPSSSVTPGNGREQVGSSRVDEKLSPAKGPPVFGRWAFAICVVPFLVYYVGTAGTAYLDSLRAHWFVKTHRGLVAEIAKQAVLRAQTTAVDHQTRLNIENLEIEKFVDLMSVREEIDLPALDSQIRRFLAENSPISADDRKLLETEYQFARELIEAEEKRLYRDVLEKGHQRRLTEDPELASQKTPWQRWFPPDRTWYPTLYSLTVLATALSMLVVAGGYFIAPLRFSWWSVSVGVLGIFVWIGLWSLDRYVLQWFNRIESRAAFNPFEELKDDPQWMYWFIAIRIVGLVLVVPIVEEFFLRGFLMRYIDDPDWDEIPLGTAGKWAIVGVFAYAALSHPSEALAALAWFGMVTWLYLKTQSLWNCVIAHAITNLLLAIYVLWSRNWVLW